MSKNADPEQKERFLEIIREEFEKAAEEGLNKKSLTASLNSLEFKYKEADFGGYPKGLIYGLNIMDSWIYDENEPLMHIDCDETFAFLRQNIESDYYENLVRKFLLNNDHSSLLALVPKKGLTAKRDAKIRAKLDELKKNLSEEEIDRMVKATKKLAAFQEAEDSKEALESIPLLKREDIKRPVEPFKNDVREAAGVPVVYHDYQTNGIAYISLLFDCNEVPVDLLPYLSLLKSIFSFVDTENYTYSELNNEINIYTGGFSFETGIYGSRKDLNRISVLSDLSIRVLYGNTDKAFDLIEEILFRSKYDDTGRLYEIIAELKSRLQMTLNSAGHVASSLRATSYYSKSGYLREKINGIEFYKFVEDLEKNFEAKKETLLDNIRKIFAIILKTDGLLVSFTGEEDGYKIFDERFGALKEKIDSVSDGKVNPIPFKDRGYAFAEEIVSEKKNEGFKTSAGVQYVARAGRYAEDGTELYGATRVLKTIMSYEYLWFNIRVQGGAYGCMCNFTPSGEASFVTYRDPNLGRSNSVFEGVPEYLENFDVDEREMTKFVIGTMSSVDTPLTPAAKGARSMSAYVADLTEEEAQMNRNGIIDCTKEDIRALAPMIRKALEDNCFCVVGNEQKIEEEKELFLETRTLFE